MYIFSDIFFVRFDIYFISSTCHYTHLVFFFIWLLIRAKTKRLTFLFWKKKNQCMYHFAINTFNTSYIHKDLYKCTHLFIRTIPMGHFAHITNITKTISLRILWNKAFKPQKIHCSIITSLWHVPSFEQVN